MESSETEMTEEMERYIEYNQLYKKLFRHPVLVQSLMRVFFREFAQILDLTTLERSRTGLNPKQQEPYNDIFWHVCRKTDGGLMVLMLEFHSYCDLEMLMRLSFSSGLYWRNLLLAKKVKDIRELPPFYPIVIYTGDKPWDEPVALDTWDDSACTEINLPRAKFTFSLLDFARLSEPYAGSQPEPVVQIVKLEQCRTRWEILETMRETARLLKDPQYTELLKSIRSWVHYLLAERYRSKGAIPPVLSTVTEFSMLPDAILLWEQEMIQKGRHIGVQRGIQRTLEYRFGAEARGIFFLLNLVNTLEELKKLLLTALEAPSLEAFQDELHLVLKD